MNLDLEAIKNFEYQCKENMEGQPIVVHKLDIKKLFKGKKYNRPIIDWRRKMLCFSSDENFLLTEPISMLSDGVEDWHRPPCHPREWVITSQSTMLSIFESLEEDAARVVFVDPEIQINQRPKDNKIFAGSKLKENRKFEVDGVITESNHPYMKLLNKCTVRKCNRSSDELQYN